jgi:hypothetical protein
MCITAPQSGITWWEIVGVELLVPKIWQRMATLAPDHRRSGLSAAAESLSGSCGHPDAFKRLHAYHLTLEAGLFQSWEGLKGETWFRKGSMRAYAKTRCKDKRGRIKMMGASK